MRVAIGDQERPATNNHCTCVLTNQMCVGSGNPPTRTQRGCDILQQGTYTCEIVVQMLQCLVKQRIPVRNCLQGKVRYRTKGWTIASTVLRKRRTQLAPEVEVGENYFRGASTRDN